MNKKAVIGLGILVILAAAYFGLNREETILVDGREMTSHHIWGKKYLLLDDILASNYGVELENSVLSINTVDISSEKNNPSNISYMDDIHVLVNGSQISYENVDGSIGLNIDTLCELDEKAAIELSEENPVGLAMHIDAYYSTFERLGFSPYRFKMNDDGSIVSLHTDSIVESDMGKVEVDQVCEFVTKTEMQDYFCLKALVDGLGARYKIRNHVLTFSGKGNEKVFHIPEVTTNYSMLGYPVLSVEFYAPGAEKISAYVDRGVLKVNGREFAEAFGYTYEEIVQKNGTEVIIKAQ